jgi:hypothetical protein
MAPEQSGRTTRMRHRFSAGSAKRRLHTHIVMKKKSTPTAIVASRRVASRGLVGFGGCDRARALQRPVCHFDPAN